MHQGRPIVTLAEQTWNKLKERLALCHGKPMSPQRANTTIQSWLDQQGPCFPHMDRDQVITHLIEVAGRLAFDEIPAHKQLLDWWQRAYARWCRLERIVAEAVQMGDAAQAPRDGGSACHVRFSAMLGRRDGASPDAPSLAFPANAEVILYTDGCCLPGTKVGGWACVLDVSTSNRSWERSQGLRRTTNNRAELTAAIMGLEALIPPCTVRLVTDSEYLALGINERLACWKAQGWRCGSGRHKRPLQNADLWQRLDAVLAKHGVRCEHVRGHSGHPENELCDRLARRAAERMENEGKRQSRNHKRRK
ncbi:MAG: ribonuclease H [Thermoguttaceae bacterium]